MSKNSPKQQYQQLTEWLNVREQANKRKKRRGARFSKAEVYNQNK